MIAANSCVHTSSFCQHWNRKTCGMQPIKTPKQAHLFYPRLVYCYKPVLQTLQEFLLRPNSHKMWTLEKEKHNWRIQWCIQWKHLEFLDYKGKPFLSLPFNFTFSLQPWWVNLSILFFACSLSYSTCRSSSVFNHSELIFTGKCYVVGCDSCT